MTDPFECLNCHHTGQLDIHGRCSRCGSEAVCPVIPTPTERLGELVLHQENQG